MGSHATWRHIRAGRDIRVSGTETGGGPAATARSGVVSSWRGSHVYDHTGGRPDQHNTDDGDHMKRPVGTTPDWSAAFAWPQLTRVIVSEDVEASAHTFVFHAATRTSSQWCVLHHRHRKPSRYPSTLSWLAFSLSRWRPSSLTVPMPCRVPGYRQCFLHAAYADRQVASFAGAPSCDGAQPAYSVKRPSSAEPRFMMKYPPALPVDGMMTGMWMKYRVQEACGSFRQPETGSFRRRCHSQHQVTCCQNLFADEHGR